MLPDGWLIYSLGDDLKDDGGKVVGFAHDFGIGPTTPLEYPSDQPAEP
jgi:hypothetical protein